MITWIQGKMTTFLGIVLIASIAINAIQQFRNTSLEREIVTLEKNIQQKDAQIGILRDNVESCKQMCLAETNALQKIADSLSRNNLTAQEALAELSKLEREFDAEKEKQGTNKSNVANPSDMLPPASARVLNDLCNRIQGSPCTSP